MRTLEHRFALIRRVVFGVLLLVTLLFAPVAQPQAALVNLDGFGKVTSVDNITVDGLTYDITVITGTYDDLFGGVFFPNAGNFITAINAELNALTPIPFLIAPFGGSSLGYNIPKADSGLSVLVEIGSCFDFTGISLLGVTACSPVGSWIKSPTNFRFDALTVPYMVPLLVPTVSAVPLPAALPLFGSALAMLGIVGWRRKRRAAA